MYRDTTGSQATRRAVAGLSVLAAMSIALGACGSSGATRAITTAGAVSPLDSPSQSAPASQPGGVPAVPASPATIQAHPAAAGSIKAAAAVPAKAQPSAPKPTSAPLPAVAAPIAGAPALPARRQPTLAELNQVIGSVHALIPLFTPTQAQIVQVGNQVCSAFDQGKTVAQVKATAMQMAGAYAALIPFGVADTAVRTVVNLFCPGYASKLA